MTFGDGEKEPHEKLERQATVKDNQPEIVDRANLAADSVDESVGQWFSVVVSSELRTVSFASYSTPPIPLYPLLQFLIPCTV